MTTPRKRAADVSDPAIPKPKQKPQEGMRETIEAVAIAFILAFVFKTFEAEAFVIPTGSMAPTLYGRHKDVACPGCGFNYAIGASTEIDQNSGILKTPDERLRSSTCPNCRRLNDVYATSVFNGDRIVVNKQVAEFERFNVVVFKNPEEPNVNFIKRLVGMPTETMRFRQGDVYARQQNETQFRIQRKPDLSVQRDIQIPVYDDNFPPTPLLKLGVEERWVPSNPDTANSEMGGWPAAENAWQPNTEARTYSVDATGGEQQWLRYRHLIPGLEHWNGADDGTGKKLPAVQTQLIADFCGFNETFTARNPNVGSTVDRELYWNSDLTLDLTIQLESSTPDGSLTLELEEGRRTVRVTIAPATGNAKLEVVNYSASGEIESSSIIAEATSSFREPGEYEISFANVDDRACLWINDELVEFGAAAELPTFDLNLPSVRDLAPVGIAVSGLKLTAGNLMLKRDIYYRNDSLAMDQSESNQTVRLRASDSVIYEVPELMLRTLGTKLRDPELYGAEYARGVAQQDERAGTMRDYQLNDDEYLMCGDNSPASQDGRLFTYWSRPYRGIESHRYAVRKEELIGEALVIFWPHAIPFLNDGKGFAVKNHKRQASDRDGNAVLKTEADYPLYVAPFYPNLSRMKVIR